MTKIQETETVENALDDAVAARVILIEGTPPILIEADENQTIAYMEIEGIRGKGVAKRNPIDHHNSEIGEMIAIFRALKDTIAQMEAVWVNRSKTKEEVAAQRAAKKSRKGKTD